MNCTNYNFYTGTCNKGRKTCALISATANTWLTFCWFSTFPVSLSQVLYITAPIYLQHVMLSSGDHFILVEPLKKSTDANTD
jgi:hypothetical protein